MFKAKLELVGEVTQFLMRIYKGVPGRGGTPYGEQASYTLLKSAGEEVAADEVTEMKPDAEIPKEEPTEPEEVVKTEPVTEAVPPEEEAPSEEVVKETAPEEEEAVEQEPDEVTEEEVPPEEEATIEPVEGEPALKVEGDVVVEEPPPPEPEPEPEPGITIHFTPESPYTTDGAEPVIVNGEVTGITEKDRFYVQIVRQGANGTTIPVSEVPLNPEGARTATMCCS